jgi:hypothetical protein
MVDDDSDAAVALVGNVQAPAVVDEDRSRKPERVCFPQGEGWFVNNDRDYRWEEFEGQRKGLAFEGERCHLFPQVGIRLRILEPGLPMSRYHWETDEEDFLVLAGEALLIIEGHRFPDSQRASVHGRQTRAPTKRRYPVGP